MRKILLFIAVLLPVLGNAQQPGEIGQYLLGKWQVEAIKGPDDHKFHPPHQSVKWDFTRDGQLIEELGSNGAKIHWHYRIVGRDITVQLGHMAFRWRIITMKDKLMLVRHQLGLFKVRRL